MNSLTGEIRKMGWGFTTMVGLGLVCSGFAASAQQIPTDDDYSNFKKAVQNEDRTVLKKYFDHFSHESSVPDGDGYKKIPFLNAGTGASGDMCGFSWDDLIKYIDKRKSKFDTDMKTCLSKEKSLVAGCLLGMDGLSTFCGGSSMCGKYSNEGCEYEERPATIPDSLKGKISVFSPPQIIKITKLNSEKAQGFLPRQMADKYFAELQPAIDAYNKKLADLTLKAGQEADDQKNLCKKSKLGFVIHAQIRIEQNWGQGVMIARLVGVNDYVCGQMADVANLLPEYFAVHGASNIKQNNCGLVYLSYQRSMNYRNEEGFQSKMPVWNVLTGGNLKRIPASLQKLKTSDWHYCQFMGE